MAENTGKKNSKAYTLVKKYYPNFWGEEALQKLVDAKNFMNGNLKKLLKNKILHQNK